MRAAVVQPPKPGVIVTDVPAPTVGPGDVRVSVVECGICGTDIDIVAGRYGAPPAGSPYLILGHENLGEVVEVGRGVAGFAAGDLVVATTRRGCGACRFCAANRSDYCETGRYTERGINGAHGYIAEQYVERPEYLVHVPRSLRSIAVLHEPLSVVEKAVSVGQQLLDRKEPTVGQPRTRVPSALVTGTGAIGMLAAMILRVRGYEVTGIDRHDPPSLAAELLGEIGATHVNATAGISALKGVRYDLIVEASGAIALDFDLVRVLRPNGVLVLTGIPDASAPPISVQGGAMLRGMVLSNEAIVGSVNANRTYFEAGTRDLAVFNERWPTVATRMISSRIPLSEAPAALTQPTGGPVKVVISMRDGPP